MVEAARLRQQEGDGRMDGQPSVDAGAATRSPGRRIRPRGVLLGRYPEWDRVQGVERLDWTSVRAVPAPLGDAKAAGGGRGGSG